MWGVGTADACVLVCVLMCICMDVRVSAFLLVLLILSLLDPDCLSFFLSINQSTNIFISAASPVLRQHSLYGSIERGTRVEVRVDSIEHAAHFLGDPKATSIHRALATFVRTFLLSLYVEIHFPKAWCPKPVS
jgi:hypothetical protein